MADHNDLGEAGEQLAADYLEGEGYEILDRNWRWRKAEADIICRKDGELVFVEVKTRSAAVHEEEELLTETKMNLIPSLVEEYVEKKSLNLESRIDLIYIQWPNKLKHIPAAMEADFG
jgi:putative endonuclease